MDIFCRSLLEYWVLFLHLPLIALARHMQPASALCVVVDPQCMPTRVAFVSLQSLTTR